jgi:hypothetical protein
VQYTDVGAADSWQELSMSFLDGMYLLNLLRAIQRGESFQMPEDPSGRGIYDPRGR